MKKRYYIFIIIGIILFVGAVPFHVFLHHAMLHKFPWLQTIGYTMFIGMWGTFMCIVEMVAGAFLVFSELEG